MKKVIEESEEDLAMVYYMSHSVKCGAVTAEGASCAAPKSSLLLTLLSLRVRVLLLFFWGAFGGKREGVSCSGVGGKDAGVISVVMGGEYSLTGLGDSVCLCEDLDSGPLGLKACGGMGRW